MEKFKKLTGNAKTKIFSYSTAEGTLHITIISISRKTLLHVFSYMIILQPFLSKGKNNNIGTLEIILPLFSFINGEMVTDHNCSKTAVLCNFL
jgi:hypothetical protein